MHKLISSGIATAFAVLPIAAIAREEEVNTFSEEFSRGFHGFLNPEFLGFISGIALLAIGTTSALLMIRFLMRLLIGR